ncbi:hypothetical protein K1719_039758 [Acacia pycnantha]|nr:hypothetical protein K1719_039758 [Acacia pycnantha]
MSVRYKCIQNYCYYCGKIGHEEKNCKSQHDSLEDGAEYCRCGNMLGTTHVKTLEEEVMVLDRTWDEALMLMAKLVPVAGENHRWRTIGGSYDNGNPSNKGGRSADQSTGQGNPAVIIGLNRINLKRSLDLLVEDQNPQPIKKRLTFQEPQESLLLKAKTLEYADGSKRIVHESWDVSAPRERNAITCFALKLNHCRNLLIKWSKQNFSNRKKMIDALKSNLSSIQQDYQTVETKMEVADLILRIEEMMDQEEKYY